jgi:hypothetical protein
VTLSRCEATSLFAVPTPTRRGYTMAHAARARAEFEAHVKGTPNFGTKATSGAKQPFMILKQLNNYWDHGRIKAALGGNSYSPHDLCWIREKYIRVFSILVLINCAEFIEEVWGHSDLKDEKLPFYSPTRPWPSNIPFDTFYEAQWQLCPQEFNRQELMKGSRFDEDRILPFEKVRCLKSGDSADTFLIKLKREYNHLHHEVCTEVFTATYLTYYTDLRSNIPAELLLIPMTSFSKHTYMMMRRDIMKTKLEHSGS